MPAFEYRTVWRCGDCQVIVEDEPAAKLRECSRDSCGTTFASEDRNCPDCNSPFTRVLAAMGCEDCGTGEMEEIEILGHCPHCHEPLEEIED